MSEALVALMITCHGIHIEMRHDVAKCSLKAKQCFEKLSTHRYEGEGRVLKECLKEIEPRKD